MRENVVLVGAGSAMFTRGLVADMVRQNWKGELRLVDTNPQALEVAHGLTRKMLATKASPLELSASENIRDVLPGATAVICTIGVGGRRAWEQDVLIPREFGIYQPVGDSVLPGGTSRALRMIPAMIAIAKDVQELCPGALFFNYGNPMSAVCRAVRKTTDTNMVGLCHGVNHLGQFLASLLKVAPEQMKYTAVGMNHLTWFTEVRIAGEDAMPRIVALAREKLAQEMWPMESGLRFAELCGQANEPAEHDDHPVTWEYEKHPFTWELTQLFGAFPAVFDRHVTEFFPHLFTKKGTYYGTTMGEGAYNAERTIAWGDRAYEEMTELALADKPLPEDYFDTHCGEHEQVIDIIDSIRTDAGRTYSANLPNVGQIPNLPGDAVVECPAIADGSGIRPVFTKALSPGLCGTLATRFQWVETVVEAAVEGNRNKFVQALLIDGAVDSVSMAEKLADALLAAQAEYLPQFA